MKFGVREICDVVLKAKANQKVGNKIFYKNEPVIYFDTLKTSSMEGAATTVYAQGGRGNSRLMAWEGERTVTFTMEDALISPAGFMILSGAGLIDADKTATIKQHITEQTEEVVREEDGSGVTVYVKEMPYWKGLMDYKLNDGKTTDVFNKELAKNNTTGYSVSGNENWIYVMLMHNGEVVSEPYIPSKITYDKDKGLWGLTLKETDDLGAVKVSETSVGTNAKAWEKHAFLTGEVVLVDYYTERTGGAQQIDITPDKFGGNYYLEASTLFRDTNGVDMPAEFIIPNCKIQSNFTFTMASSGDPSTFTFAMDAFPDYTRFDNTKKVLAAIQIISTSSTGDEYYRGRTQTVRTIDDAGIMSPETDSNTGNS